MAGTAADFWAKRNREMYSQFLRLISVEMNGVNVDGWGGNEYLRLSSYTDDLHEASRPEPDDARWRQESEQNLQNHIDHFESFFAFMGEKDAGGKSNYEKLMNALPEEKQTRLKKYLLAANIDMGIGYDLDSMDPAIRNVWKDEENKENKAAQEEKNEAEENVIRRSSAAGAEEKEKAAEQRAIPEDWDELTEDELSAQDKKEINETIYNNAANAQYDQYMRLLKEGKHKEIARNLCDVHLQLQKNPRSQEYLGKEEAEGRFYEIFTENGILRMDKYDDLIKIVTELAKIQVEAKVEFGKAVTEYADKIMNGEVPGLEQFKGSRTAALDIAGSYMCASEYGRRADMPSQLIGAISTEISSRDEHSLDAGLVIAKQHEAVKGKAASLPEKDAILYDMYNALKYNAAEGYGLKVVNDWEAQEVRIEPRANAKNVREPKKYRSAEEVTAEIKGLQESFDKTKKLYDVSMDTLNRLTKTGDALFKSKKAGHEDGKEFLKMQTVLGDLFGIHPESDLEYGMMKTGLGKIKKAAQEYIDTHSKWYQNNFGYGAERLKVARELVKVADDGLKQMEEAFKESGLTERDEVAKAHLSAGQKLAFMQEIKKDFPELQKEQQGHKKLEGDDLKNFLQGDKKVNNKKPKRTVSASAPAVDLEAPKVDTHMHK